MSLHEAGKIEVRGTELGCKINRCEFLIKPRSLYRGAQEGCVGAWGDMDPVVVMHVHEDGDRLSENNAAPHNYVANLSFHAWQGGKNAQGNLLVVCVQWKRMVQCLFTVDDGARKLRRPLHYGKLGRAWE